MVSGPLLVVALAVASIATAAPIFDLGWFFDYDSQESEEITSEKQGIKNIVVVGVSGNSVSGYPNVFTVPDASDRVTTIPNNGATVSLPTPSGGVNGPGITTTLPPNGINAIG